MSRSVKDSVSLIGALLLLNSALSFHNVWPTLWVTIWPELSVEIAALIVVLALWQRLRGSPSAALNAAIAVLLVVMTLGRYLEVTAPALFGRAINLYWDAQYVPDVAAMLARSAPIYLTFAVVGGLVVGLMLLFGLLRWAVGRLSSALAENGWPRYLPTAAAVLVGLYLLGYNTSVPTLRWFSIPLMQTYARQIAFTVRAIGGSEALAALPDASPLDGLDLTGRPRADVIVTFVESYGAVAFDADPVASALVEPRRAFAAAIAATGRSAVSAFVTAPTFGGGSWLSHASLMSGIRVADAGSYSALLTQSRPTLPRLFGAAGYRTVALMPGLKNEWPEGSFYGFDAILGESRLGYAGPEFGWWRIPDQYALARLDEWELSPSDRAPVFVFFPTISTHMPFRPTPPYQPDWQRVGTAAPFTTEELGDRLAESPQWTNLRPAYADTLAYTYAYWGGWLERNAGRDFLLVLLGDHQPPAAVSGEGARHDVPVHVITRDGALVRRLLEHGFVVGMQPDREPVAEMHELAVLLLGTH